MPAKKRAGKVSIKRKNNAPDGVFVATFRDPRRWQDPKDTGKGRKVVRRSLKTRDYEQAKRYQAELERIIADRSLWKVPPDNVPLVVREIWLGAKADVEVETPKGKVQLPWSPNAKRSSHLELNVNDVLEPYDGEWPGLIEVEGDYPESAKTLTVAEAYKLAVAELEEARKTIERISQETNELRDEKAALELKLRRYNRRAAKAAQVGTLAQEAEKYLRDYDARKITKRRKGILRNTVDRFVQEMGADRKADDIAETEVSKYVQGYHDAKGNAIGEERRREIRRAICTFLEAVTEGVFDRKRVKRVAAHSVARERRNPIYLTQGEATSLIEKMYELHGAYWGDFAKVQLHMGWRPTEIALLQQANVSDDHVELVPVKDQVSGVSHGKTGARSVRIHPDVRDIIETRVSEGEGMLLFPFPRKLDSKRSKTKRRNKSEGLLAEAWDQGVLSKEYLIRIRAAAELAKIKKPVDSRTLRRTFGSVAIRNGLSVEEVAVLMGNRPSVVRKHYARLLPDEVHLERVNFTRAPSADSRTE